MDFEQFFVGLGLGGFLVAAFVLWIIWDTRKDGKE